MAKKPKAERFRTPRGIAVYPRLNTPDTGFHKHGVYKADLRLSGKAAQELIDHIQAQAVEKFGEKLDVSTSIIKKKGKYRPNEDNNCFQPAFDHETGEMIAGEWVFMFRAKNHEFKDKKTGEMRMWDRKPDMFSASGKPVPKAKVGAGSEYAVVYEIFHGKTSAGDDYLQLQPVAVQIYKLVEFQSGSNASAEDYGLEAEEGWDPEEDEDDDMIERDDTADDQDDDDLEEGEDDF